MAYFHIDGAIRYLRSLGYKGRRAIFRKPFEIDVDGTAGDNSEYSPHLHRITLGRGGVPDAEDADVILHEFGHAIQDAICPNFGQSAEAAAMGEGFGDYLAASYFDDKRSFAYRTSIMTWDGVMEKEFRPPCQRRVDSPKTYATFHGRADEHETGEIWSATLWDVAMAIGRRAADRIIVGSHFQLDGYTTFAQGGRAILDADCNLYRGRHAGVLHRIFARRNISLVDEP